MMRQPKLVIELTLHSRRHQPHRPTILMTKYSFFPYFGDEGFEDEESQEQPLIVDRIHTMTLEIIGNILHSEEEINESPFLLDA